MTQVKAAFFGNTLALFPEAIGPYEQMQREYGKVLETVMMEDVFYPAIEALLQEESDVSSIGRVFGCLEQAAGSGDEELVNLLSVTILEKLGSDRNVLNTARRYMGANTRLLQVEADRHLGRRI